MEVAGIRKLAHKCKTLGKRQMQRGQGEEKDECATAGPGYLSMKDGRRAGSQNRSHSLAEVGRHLWRSPPTAIYILLCFFTRDFQ